MTNSVSVCGAEDFRFGRVLADHEQGALETVIWPDGRNLPPGAGSVAEGKALFAARCIACHGPDGRGGAGGELAGGNPDLTATQPDQTVGTYWPYASTLFDFIRRSMPLDAPWSLADNEVYALTAYILSLNGILGPDNVLDAASLRVVEMPNRNGFEGVEANWP